MRVDLCDMKFSTVVLACTPVLGLASTANAKPKPDVSLRDDIASVSKVGNWFSRSTFVGWTANHGAVYRTATCDRDDGGGRGQYCEIKQCVAQPRDTVDPVDDKQADCETLLSVDLYEDPQWRATIYAVDIQSASAKHLATLGKISDGKPAERKGKARLELSGNSVVVVVKDTRAAPCCFGPNPAIRRTAFQFAKTDEGGTNSVSQLKVQATLRSPDGTCTAVVGSLNYHGHYEGVPFAIPTNIAEVVCH
jgi:hypothetical protein